MTPHDAIRDVFLDLKRAYARKNARALLACHAPGALVFNLAPPLASRGRGLAETEAWRATWIGVVCVDLAEAEIHISRHLARVTALNRIRGTKQDGEIGDMWFRTAMRLHRTWDRWLIVHDHSSTPFYMDGSFWTATDLLPQA